MSINLLKEKTYTQAHTSQHSRINLSHVFERKKNYHCDHLLILLLCNGILDVKHALFVRQKIDIFSLIL